MKGFDDCGDSLSNKEVAKYIKEFCSNRVEKYGLHSVRSGACKSCPYRYRGERRGTCCIFGNLPYTWGDDIISEKYN